MPEPDPRRRRRLRGPAVQHVQLHAELALFPPAGLYEDSAAITPRPFSSIWKFL
jgi:hypothetical protein